MNNVGNLLRLKRQEKNYTLQKVAEAVGVSINYISKLEKGENSNPSDEVIVKLALILGIDEDSLFNSFDKIPLSTRRVLRAYPILVNIISEIRVDKNIKDEKLEEFFIDTIRRFGKLSEDK